MQPATRGQSRGFGSSSVVSCEPSLRTVNDEDERMMLWCWQKHCLMIVTSFGSEFTYKW